MSAIYEEHKSVSNIFLPCVGIADALTIRDEDNFLYVSYSGENTFGQEAWLELPSDA